MRSATALIDLAALQQNYAAIKAQAPNSKILAVLKANAYGHGLERIAKALPQADAFGVARIEEALALRTDGIVKPIVLLEGFFTAQDLPILAVNNLQTIVHNEQQLTAILNADLDKPLKVWLKVDTGMHRLGVNPEQFEDFYQQLTASDNVQNDIVVMSHLGCADDTQDTATTEQLARFNQLTASFGNEKSLANSAGIWAWPECHFQWVRPGLMLYGVSPMIHDTNNNAHDIVPVMTLQASLIAIRDIKAGEGVGYGANWRSDKDTTIGVIAIGYGDGYPRHAANGTPVLINGRRVPLVGRVSMDMITVDLGQTSTDNLGDVATLWGESLSVAEVAAHATTIPYELLCNISKRVNSRLK
ncbi:alanine racemase [Thalassotalea sp. PP2-459]|uniref:alanine racemase n=1 Tax=Thalassotalea sp. PP2-459 TaxID=1742724 RepID=UPI0009427961|nr:alanine racemase [Thalassotalea sp. PP2-459]OKY28065.1 alanine racemase [Thalassotalea sp. PP2-459]